MSAIARGAPGRGRLAFLVPPLLRDTAFRRFSAASTVSMFGDQVSGIAVPLTAVIAWHAGAAPMGYLTALQWLPSLLLGVARLARGPIGAGGGARR